MADVVAIPLRGSDAALHDVHIEERPKRCGLCPEHRPKRCYSYNLVMCVSALTPLAFLICAGVLIALTVTMAGPHLKALNFVAGNCTVVNATFTGDSRSCECGSRTCKGTYPCFAVIVKYVTRDGRVIESMLHEEEHVFTYRPLCSYQPPGYCSEGRNPNSIDYFKNHYGIPGRSYPCFHNPTGPGALRLRTKEASFILHVILWPALLMVVFFILWCTIYFCCCGRDPETGEWNGALQEACCDWLSSFR